AEIEKKTGIKAPDPAVMEQPCLLPFHTEESTWDSLVKEANTLYPQALTFEDLLSQDEIDEVCKYLDGINEDFSKKTKLKKLDGTFLAIATALQCLRQYVIDPWLKKQRASSKSTDEKGRKNNGGPGWYYVQTENILTNRCPYDAQRYNPANPALKGFLAGAKDHRYVTLGHDPLLGWVFGTANIMTSTITRYDFKTAHVKYKPTMMIHSFAETSTMAQKCMDRVTKEGMDGKLALGSAVIRQAIHLKSDINTKHSLPIPVISTVSPAFAETLASYGVDAAGIGTEMSLSLIINWLISIIHGLFYDESEESQEMYEVRTRKVLLYSNLLASTSNIIVTALTKDVSKLDVGGLIVTIGKLFSDVRFITKVKLDFIDSKLDVQFQGIESELDQLYNNNYSF
ncbi:MAG: hypothetical protein IJM10_05620, partial [Clostridia bacterium]|nr:hypothetical protein [Clostridia bacterium]